MGYPKILHDNRLDDATPSASGTASGDYNVLYLRDWRPYTYWKPDALPATVTVNCGSAKAADYALLWGHQLYTGGCTVEIRGSTDNFSASDVLVATSTPTSDDPLFIAFASASYQYWRIKITGSTAPAIAIAAIGAAIELPAYLAQGFDPIGRALRGQQNTSIEGHPLGTVYDYEKWEETIKIENVSWSWVRDTFLPAWEAHLRAEPFGFVWEPTSYSDEVRLVSVKGGQFKTPHRAGSYADLDLPIYGVVT